MIIDLFSNPYCYYKALSQYKKYYRQRGMFTRCCKMNNLYPYYQRFGEFHFKSDLEVYG